MTQIRTLLNGMAENSFKRLTLSSEETSMANALARTKANFDFNGSTWANDTAVAANPPLGSSGGIGSLLTSEMWAFSGAAISEQDGKCTFTGGGHTDSGDGSIFTLDPEEAAANINGGGSGIAWTLAQPSCMYIDAFTNSRPSSATSPVGAIQNAPTTPTGTTQAFWTMPNKNGITMPVCCHTYHLLKYLPGTRKVLISGFFGFDVNAIPFTNAAFYFDDSNRTITGPLTTTTLPFSTDQHNGYAGRDSGNNPLPLMVNDLDGLPYVFWTLGGSFTSIKWTDPLNASSSLAAAAANNSSNSFEPQALADAIIIPDPGNSSKRITFSHFAASDADFILVQDVGDGSGFIKGTYASGSVTTRSPHYNHFAGPRSGKIWFTDGDHLFQVTTNATSSLWTIAQVTGFTGDVPPNPDLVSGTVPTFQYVATHDCFIHVQSGGVRIFKPTGWSPGVDPSPPLPYQPWYQRGPILAQ